MSPSLIQIKSKPIKDAKTRFKTKSINTLENINIKKNNSLISKERDTDNDDAANADDNMDAYQNDESILSEVNKYNIDNNNFDIEQGLTQENLKDLHEIFLEMDKDGNGGIDKDEFNLAIKRLRKVTGYHIKDSEIYGTFMKIDANCDDVVDWQEYLTYVLTSMKEKETMVNLYKEITFPKTARTIPNMYRYQKTLDVCVSILWIPNLRRETINNSIFYKTVNVQYGKYLTVSRDGVLNFWDKDLVHEKKIQLSSNQQMKMWVTDSCFLLNINSLAISLTNNVIAIYDMQTFHLLKIDRVTTVIVDEQKKHSDKNNIKEPIEYSVKIDVEVAATCLNFWYDDDRPWHCILFWGNMKGGICFIEFDGCKKLCILLQSYKISSKTLIFSEMIRNNNNNQQYCGATATEILNVHNDFVLKLKYYRIKDFFVSCSSSTDTALYIGDIRQINKVWFSVNRGVTTFDYSYKNNMVVTAGQDCIVRIWDPYIPVKPIIYLIGHKNPIIGVIVDEKKDELITVSKEKDVLIFDLTTQMCSQTIGRSNIFLGKQHVTALCYNPYRRALLLGNNHLSILEHKLSIKGENDELQHSELITHYNQFSCMIYNSLFNNVVTGGIDGYVYVFNFETGERLLQYSAHRIEIYGQEEGLEITTLSFDDSLRRLFTAGRDGLVRCWNYNNGMLLGEFTQSKGNEVMTIVSSPRKKIYIAGWNRILIEYDDNIKIASSASTSETTTIFTMIDENQIIPTIYEKRHQEDIQTASVYGNICRIATASYDGDIFIWNTETHQALMKFNANISRKPHLSIFEKFRVNNKKSDKKTTKNSYKRNNKYSTNKLLSTDSVHLLSKQQQTQYLSHIPKMQISSSPPPPPTTTTFIKTRRMTQVLKDTSKILNKYISDQDFAIYKLLFLINRMSTPRTATLVAAGARGWIRFWSIKPNGGLIGQFNGSHLVGDSILNLVSDEFNFYLISGDTSGYVKVWDIADYCMELNNDEKYKERIKLLRSQYKIAFPLLSLPVYVWNRVLLQNKHLPPPNCTLPQLTWTAPQLLASFRAHLRPIHSIDYVNEKQIILTCCFDRSVRLFSLTGQFLGILGQNCKDPPLFLNMFIDDYHKIKKKLHMRSKIKYNPPKDILRQASPTTLFVNKRGYSKNWTNLKNALIGLQKQKNNQLTKTIAINDFIFKIKRMRNRNIIQNNGLFGLCGKEQHDRSQCIKPPLGEILDPLKSDVLGKSYKKLRNFQNLSSIRKEINYEGEHLTIYKNLSTYQLDDNIPIQKSIEMQKDKHDDDSSWMKEIFEYEKHGKNTKFLNGKSKNNCKTKYQFVFEDKKKYNKSCKKPCIEKLPKINKKLK